MTSLLDLKRGDDGDAEEPRRTHARYVEIGESRLTERDDRMRTAHLEIVGATPSRAEPGVPLRITAVAPSSAEFDRLRVMH